MNQEQQDYNSVWLTISSNHHDRSTLSEISGFSEPATNSLGMTPKGKNLSIKSDEFLHPDLGMDEHISWLVSAVRGNKQLFDLLKSNEIKSEIFLYTITDEDAAYTAVGLEFLKFIVEIGSDLLVKVEVRP